jgi:hypothetical protein
LPAEVRFGTLRVMPTRTRAFVIGLACLSASLLAASTGRAEDVPPPGLRLGARVGYAFPSGDSRGKSDFGDFQLSSAIDGVVPIMLDAMYEFDFGLAVGLFGQYGHGVRNTGSCEGYAECDASVIRVGAQAQYFLYGETAWVPWVGGGFGWERFAASTRFPEGNVEFSYTGWELLQLQGGLDYELTLRFRLGLFAQQSIGQYQSASTTTTRPNSIAEGDVDLEDKALHFWTTLGVRALASF